MFAECEENVLTFFREQREKINTKKNAGKHIFEIKSTWFRNFDVHFSQKKESSNCYHSNENVSLQCLDQ